MSFADLESGALRAPRKARAHDATRALVFQITTAVPSYRRLLNSVGTPKDTPTLRDQLQKTSHKVLQLAKDAKDKLRSAAEADKSTGTSVMLTWSSLLNELRFSSLLCGEITWSFLCYMRKISRQLINMSSITWSLSRTSDSSIIWRPPVDFPDARPGCSSMFMLGSALLIHSVEWITFLNS